MWQLINNKRDKQSDIAIYRKYLAQSDDISCGALSEIQNRQKQKTGTGHLVNRLVQQNA